MLTVPLLLLLLLLLLFCVVDSSPVVVVDLAGVWRLVVGLFVRRRLRRLGTLLCQGEMGVCMVTNSRKRQTACYTVVVLGVASLESGKEKGRLFGPRAVQ